MLLMHTVRVRESLFYVLRAREVNFDTMGRCFRYDRFPQAIHGRAMGMYTVHWLSFIVYLTLLENPGDKHIFVQQDELG